MNGAGNYQWYHGDLKGRALALLPVLTGNIGKSGAGISTYAGQYRIRFKVAEWWVPEGKKQNWLPFLYVLHGPTKTMKAKWPKNGIKALVVGWGNPFDQHNMANKLREMVEQEDLEFVVTTDFQMTTTCQYSHAVLPAVSWYEKTDLVATPVHPYLQLQQPAVKPIYEGQPEFWIIRELAKRLNPEFEKYFYPGLEPDEAAQKVMEIHALVFGRYGLLYATEILLPAFTMLLFFTEKGKSSYKALMIGSVLLFIGVFAHRLMLIFPAFNVVPLSLSIPGAGIESWAYPVALGQLREGLPVFVSSYDYMPTLVEYAVALLPFGIVLLVVTGALKMYNFMPKKHEVTSPTTEK